MDGQDVDTSGRVWILHSSSDGGRLVRINWDLLDGPARCPALSRRAIHFTKLYLIDRMRRRKAMTIEHDFDTIRRFDQWLDRNVSKARRGRFEWRHLNEKTARAFLNHGVKNTANKGNDFSRLRTFYRWGYAHQAEGFDLQTVLKLRSIRAIGNPKGHHVRFRHATKGPLSSDEQLLVSNACAQGKGTDRDRALVLLHLELGVNPNSTARLKHRDFKSFNANNIETYQLDVPRVKKRTSKRQTKRRNISIRLGDLIKKLQSDDFHPDDPLFYWLRTRSPEDAISQAMHRFVRDAKIRSPRTGHWLNLTPRRCRTSLATQMGEDGASRFHIAEVLDHTDLQNVAVYTETVSSISDAVAKATDDRMGPLVDRFLGRVVDSLNSLQGSQPIPVNTPHLSLPILNTGGIGGCGRDVTKDGLCELFPPLSCYLCPFFAALRDGPHSEVLRSLEAYIQRNQSHADPRILSQLSDVILALRTVLKKVGMHPAEFLET